MKLKSYRVILRFEKEHGQICGFICIVFLDSKKANLYIFWSKVFNVNNISNNCKFKPLWLFFWLKDNKLPSVFFKSTLQLYFLDISSILSILITVINLVTIIVI